jgi:hypothetical protein
MGRAAMARSPDRMLRGQDCDHLFSYSSKSLRLCVSAQRAEKKTEQKNREEDDDQ